MKGAKPRAFLQDWCAAPDFLDRRPDSRLNSAIVDQMAAFREGIGTGGQLMVDLGFSQRADGFMVSEFFTDPAIIEDGKLVVPNRPGWGTDVNEEALSMHPPKKER